MIVICEECGKNYRIDADKLKQDETQFKCKDCGHQIAIRKPEIPITEKESHPAPATAEEPLQPTGPAVPEISSQTAKVNHETDKYAFARSPKPRFGLTAKLFIIMIVVSLVPLSMFWGITLKQTRDLIRYESRKNLNRQYSSIVRYMDEWFYNKIDLVKSLTGYEPMVSMQKDRQEALFAILRKLHVDMDAVFSIDPQGHFLAGNLHALPRVHKEMSYFKAIQAQTPIAWQTVLTDKTNQPGLIIAAPIIDQNTLVGVLGCLIGIDKVSDLIQIAGTRKAAFALLIRKGKDMIVHPADDGLRKAEPIQWQPIIERLNQGEGGLLPVQGSDGKPRLTFVDTTAFGWGLAVQAEGQETLPMLNRLMSFAYLLLAVTVVFVFIIAWFAGRTLSRPIIRLTNATNRISVGELDMEIRTKRKDEIGALSDAIARMQDSIRLSIERLRRRR